MPAEALVQVKTFFAPFDQTTEAYLAFVKSAKRDVRVIIYGFHLPALTDTLIAQHQAGLHVNLILDHTQAGGRAEAGEVAKLVAAGVPLLIGTSPVHHQILHTKATIIDEEAVESGSWNYSLSASQQSNTLTFVHDRDYARAYLDHWHRLHGFLVLHDMVYQPQGAVVAEDVPADDIVPDDTSNTGNTGVAPTSAPAAASSSPVAGNPPSASGVSVRRRAAPSGGRQRPSAKPTTKAAREPAA